MALASGATVGWLPPKPSELAPYFPGYEIEALIARGGMGAVYRARQLSLNRPVAIKLLPFDLGMREDFAERFRREAEALARLQHPHIVAVHDFGQADDGHYFMVMEFVEGEDLAMRLRTRGPLPADEALRIVKQVCEALHYAHERGVVHRDIKPANILLDANGRVKVSDFGIAQFAREDITRALTASGTMLGTPDYTAPEQLTLNGPVDARADIFSVGVMLYELLTGQLPRGVFRPVSELVPSARGLDAVLARAMQSEPGRRQAGVLELSAELVEQSKPRSRTPVLWIAAMLGGVGAWMLWPRTEARFVNSLGLAFVPAGTERAWFCTTETRVRDFEAFWRARQTNFSQLFPQPVFVNYDGTREGWTVKEATWREPTFSQTPDDPVVAVAHFEAVSFCEWLTTHERESGRIGSHDRYRLPTDTEWSLAAGLQADAHDPAGAFPWGGEYPPSAEVGNYASEELREDAAFAKLPVITGRRDRHRFTAPVGSYPPNKFGLHDMGGNAIEWMQRDGEGLIAMRGASWWESTREQLDAGHRVRLSENTRSFTLGFRIVLERATTP